MELRGITQRFPGVIACDKVDLDVYTGEIHALVGEKGAGKTTLMQVLYGLHQPDAGEIWIDGKRTLMRSPKEAIRAGIGMMFQDFTLILSLTVAENIALAAPGARMFMRRQSLLAHIQELGVRYEWPIDPNSHVWQLSIGEQQRVEIFKLLHRRTRLLILDEPSAGACEVAGVQGRLKYGLSPGYGYTAIIVAWLARLNPWATIVASIFLGGLLVGSDMLQVSMNLPVAVAYVLQGLVLFALLSAEFLVGHRVVWKRRSAG